MATCRAIRSRACSTGSISRAQTGVSSLFMGAVPRAGHQDIICCAAVAEDGSFMVTASDDKTARVWDLDTGACAAVLPHSAPLTVRSDPDPDPTRPRPDAPQLWP